MSASSATTERARRRCCVCWPASTNRPSGRCRSKGGCRSFTDITLGMDQEATGLENIIFRCVFMGLSFAEARRLSPSIQEFSELGEFLRLPVRTYSTGMFLRLAFAISTSIEPDIIIMDEMIGGGDARFMERAKARLTSLLERTKILVLATHGVGIMAEPVQQGRLARPWRGSQDRLVRRGSPALSCGERKLAASSFWRAGVALPRRASCELSKGCSFDHGAD